MPNTTKQALEESLKHMLLKKPLDKITIRDITEDCGISRMAFYYHFTGPSSSTPTAVSAGSRWSGSSIS